MSEPDLVSLLYRADWTRLSLAAEVNSSLDLDLLGRQSGDGPHGPPEPPGGHWAWSGAMAEPPVWPFAAHWDEMPDEPLEGPPWRRPPGKGRPAGDEWEVATDQQGTQSNRFTLLIAPGRRYRQDSENSRSGCDGNRSWRAFRDDDGWTAVAMGGPTPPVPKLVRPSWLLTGFSLEVAGPVTVGGRDALRVVATPGASHWAALRDRRFAVSRPLDRVEVIVDAGLGILLRHEEILDGRPLRVTELTVVRVDPSLASDDAWCQPPGGWDSLDEDEPPFTVRGPGWEAAKLAAGLAAGGIGALIRSSPFRPFEQATREEPEAEMPAPDEPLPADGPDADDEVLHLLHASRDRWTPGITATLHEWFDPAALMSRIPEGVRRAGFGGLGFLIDTTGERVATVHRVSRLRLGGSGQYRIEPIGNPGRRQRETFVCDGERRWRIGEDEVTAGPAGPPPREIADLFDSSWLLEWRLSGGFEMVSGGREGYRFGVTADRWPRPGLFTPDEIVMDAELGILLRLICTAWSLPVLRYELRDVVTGPVEPGDFQPDIPAGTRVVEEEPPEWPPGPPGPARVAGLIAREARSAFRSVFGGSRD